MVRPFIGTALYQSHFKHILKTPLCTLEKGWTQPFMRASLAWEEEHILDISLFSHQLDAVCRA